MYIPRSPRRPIPLKAEYDDGARVLTGRVTDMSTSGLFVETEDLLPVGARITVVPLAEGSPAELRIPAEVVRNSADPQGRRGLAIRFTFLDAWRREHVRALLYPERVRPGDRSTATRRPQPLPQGSDDHAPILLLTPENTAQVANSDKPRLRAVPAAAEIPTSQTAVTPLVTTFPAPRLVPAPAPVAAKTVQAKSAAKAAVLVDADEYEGLKEAVDEATDQLIELGRRAQRADDEAARLRQQVQGLLAQSAQRKDLEETLQAELQVERNMRGRVAQELERWAQALKR